MMNDEQLRDAFSELQRAEAARAPRFERMWRRRSAQRRFSFAFVFVTLLMIVLTVAVVRRPVPQPSISEWHAPTDFLLRTPGRQLLDSVPDLKGNLQ